MGGHLDHTSEFEGKLRFSETMRIDGRFKGDIESDGHLVIGEKAVVHASIRAASITVAGHVKGSMQASERVEVFKEGRLECDVVTPSIRIEDGAVFQGMCETSPPPREQRNATRPPLDMNQVSRKIGG